MKTGWCWWAWVYVGVYKYVYNALYVYVCIYYYMYVWVYRWGYVCEWFGGVCVLYAWPSFCDVSTVVQTVVRNSCFIQNGQ